MSEQVNYDPFASGDVVRIVPTTEQQQEIWTAARIDAKASCAFNAPLLLQFKGKIQYNELLSAYSQLINRRDALRGSFSPDGNNFVVAANIDADLPLIEISGIDSESKQNSLDEFIETAAATPFNLEFGPLIRSQLLRFSDSENYLLITVHHIVCDGWSTGILLNELAELYSAEVGKRQPNLLPAPSFADYASELHVNQGSEGYLASRSYWLAQYADEPSVLDLPLDKPRPAKRTFNADRYDCFIDSERTRALTEIAASTRTTLFTTLFAVFQILLWKRCGQADLVIGFSAAAQPISGNSELLGHCVNLLPIRFKLDDKRTFAEHLGTLRPHIYDALEHQEFGFGGLLKELNIPRDLSRIPLVPVVFNFEAYSDEFSFDGVDTAFSSGARSSEAFELFLNVVSHPDKIELQCSYNTDLFRADTITRMLCHYENLLASICEDKDQVLGKLPLMSEEERTRVIECFNQPRQLFPVKQCLHEIFEYHVAVKPDAIAVTFEGAKLTYSELDQKSNQVAHYLIERGVGPEMIVGICLERSLELVIGLLGILKAGGAYLPLDLSYPAERVAFMLEDSNATVLITQQSLVQNFPQTNASILALDELAKNSLENYSVGKPERRVKAGDLAYVIYTSGSTGKPKGVRVTHYNVVRLLQSTEHWFGFNETDVWTLFHSYAFDFSVWEIWGALGYGGRLVIVPQLVSRSPKKFYQLLSEENVTVLNQTPSAFRQLIQLEESGLQQLPLSLRYIIFGGEALDISSLKPWFDRHGDITPQLINMYGITETTVHVTYRPLTAQDLTSGSMIGKPIPDLQIYILDANREPNPIGVPGEMYVGGAGVARGYLNRDLLTQERFIADPFSSEPGAHLYRTGDLARFLNDGDIEYLGRIDQQIKLRGFRIELGEIESVISSHAAVKQCVVEVREDRPGDQRLIAYVVLVPGAGLKITEMRQQAGTQLPDYMVPQHLVELDKLPLTPNGKLDRQALPAPTMQQSDDESFKAAETDLEIYLTNIWSKIFLKEDIGVNDNFFEIGGHSLLAIQIANTLSRDLDTEIPVQSIFEHPCILDLAQAIEKQLIEELEKLSASEDVGR